mmetsp:Transcript_14934/g.35165  ORF Transcript_14934/g.35165 Transcript_14934/m.35165 type:complete len:147 (+) Transcript_14934:1-441(+)
MLSLPPTPTRPPTRPDGHHACVPTADALREAAVTQRISSSSGFRKRRGRARLEGLHENLCARKWMECSISAPPWLLPTRMRAGPLYWKTTGCASRRKASRTKFVECADMMLCFGRRRKEWDKSCKGHDLPNGGDIYNDDNIVIRSK